MLLPQQHDFYDRFLYLKDLNGAELSRWRRYLEAFAQKISMLAGRRRLLFKSPSHTARVQALLDIFPGAKFVHISRDPGEVIRSNLTMNEVFHRYYHLQDALPLDQSERDLIAEYLATENSYLEARANLPGGQVCEVRLQDLVADPVAEIERIYSELHLEFTDAFRRRLIDYLRFSTDYQSNVHSQWSEEHAASLKPVLSELARNFGQDLPNVVPAVLSPVATKQITPATWTEQWGRPAAAALLAALSCGLIWTAIATFTKNDLDSLVWPAGIAIGYVCSSAVVRGSPKLGSWSAFLTLALLLVVACFNTAHIDLHGLESIRATDILGAALRRLSKPPHLLWSLIGASTAYRLANRLRP
jgi:hypothetical protein